MIRVGLVVPRSGRYKQVGDDLNNGFQLYLKLHSNKLGGHPIEVTTADEGETADSAKAAVDKLVKQSSAQVLTGVASSTAMTAIRDQVEAAQTPLVGSNASPTALGSVKYIWRTSYVNSDPGTALGGYVAQYLTTQNKAPVYVLYDDTPGSRDGLNGFITAYTGVAGHPDVATDPVQVPLFSNPGTSLTPYLDAIRTSPAKAVVAFFQGTSAVHFVKAYRAANLSQTVFAPGFLTEGDVLKQQGDAANGIYTSLNYSPDLDNAANRVFASEYQASYNTPPSTYAMASYDAAAVLDKALGLAGNDLTSQSINAALGRVGEIDSPRGNWQFNQSRTPLQKWYLRQVRRDGALLSNVLLSDLATLG